MTRTLDRRGQLTLMSCAGAGYTTGQDLASLGHVTAKTRDILIIDMLYFINTETANFLAGLSAAIRSVSHFQFSFQRVLFINSNLSKRFR